MPVTTAKLAELRHVAADRDRRALLRSHMALLGGSTALSWLLIATRTPTLEAFLAAPIAPLTISGGFRAVSAVIVAWLFGSTMAALTKPTRPGTALATAAMVCYAIYAVFAVLWVYVACG